MAQETHRIGKMSLRISAPSHPAASEGEAFVRAVFEKTGDELDRRHPGEVFCVDQLSLTWDLDPRELGSPTGVEQYALQLADAIEAMCPPANGGTRSSSRQGFRFSSPAEYWARYLEEGSRAWGSLEWPFDVHGAAHPLESALYSAPASVFREAMRLLASRRFEALVSLVSSAVWDVIHSVMRQLGLEIPPHEVDPMEQITSAAAVEPVLLLLRCHLPEARHARTVLAWAALARTSHLEPQPEWIRQVLSQLPAPGQTVDPEPRSQGTASEAADVIMTGYAGAVFLLNLILELELGDLLWSAMLPEGEMLRRALSPFWTDEEDGLLRLLFRSHDLEWPGITESQQEEIAVPLALRLATAWTRRDLAEQPVWQRRELAGGWWALWSSDWADDPVLVGRQTAAWDELPVRIEDGGPAEGRFTAESALASQIRGSLAALWTARTGASPREFLQLPGTCVLTPGEAKVQIDIAHQDLRLRKAGLDRDPGWIEWIQRAVTIEFRGESEQLL